MSDGTVLLVRHGETEWNRTRRVQGWAPVGLDDTGRRQARSAADRIASEYDVDRIVASDLRRTRETARILGRSLEVPDDRRRFDRAWRERDFGVYQGLSYEALFDGHPEFAIGTNREAALQIRPEGGESLLEARDRVLGAFRSLVAGLSETVLVVTHGGPIHVVRAHVDGRDLVAEIENHSPDNCSIAEFAVTGDSVQIRPRSSRRD
jgi:probable phosphoglycerate mutase